jgi:tetratricopeptide (TPR) repeat protein
VGGARNNVAINLEEQGRYAEAEAEYRAALSLWEKALGPDHPDVAGLRNNVALVLQRQGRLDEAQAELEAALAIRRTALGADHPSVAASLYNLGSLSYAQGKYAEAQTRFRAALKSWHDTLGDDHPDVAMARSSLAASLANLDRFEEALPLAERAWARRQRDDIPVDYQAETSFVLARILWDIDGPSRDRHRARRLAERALRVFREDKATHADEFREVQRWLDDRTPG